MITLRKTVVGLVEEMVPLSSLGNAEMIFCRFFKDSSFRDLVGLGAVGGMGGQASRMPGGFSFSFGGEPPHPQAPPPSVLNTSCIFKHFFTEITQR